MTRMALKVETDGTTERVDLDAGELEVLQTAVRGEFEAITLSEELTMFVNEEYGLLFDYADWNVVAITTMMFAARRGDTILGPVVFTGGVDEDGDTLPLPERCAVWIETVATMARAERTGRAA